MNPSDDFVVGYTKKVHFGCGNVYMTVNVDASNQPIQVFMQVGKAGCCQKTLLEGVCRLANRLFDRGEPLEEIAMCLVGLRCDQGIAGAGCLSCADALGHLLKSYTIQDLTPEPLHGLPVQQVP